MMERLILVVVWMIIYGYMMITAIDFGTGFFLLFTRKNSMQTGLKNFRGNTISDHKETSAPEDTQPASKHLASPSFLYTIKNYKIFKGNSIRATKALPAPKGLASPSFLYNRQAVGVRQRYIMMQQFLSPWSELMNLGFVLLFTVLVGRFPEMMLNYQTPLVMCGVLALLLTVLKGTFFALTELLPGEGMANRFFATANGVTGMLIPLTLSVVLVISEGGFSNAGTAGAARFVIDLVTNVYFWSVLIVGAVSILYISIMYHVAVAASVGGSMLTEHLRVRALYWSIPMVLSSGLVFLGLERQNPDHFLRALDHAWLFMLSLACLLLAVTRVFLKRFRGVFALVVLQFFFAFFGYTVSHFPYIIDPEVVIDQQLYSWARSGSFFLTMLLFAPGILLAAVHWRERYLLHRAERTE